MKEVYQKKKFEAKRGRFSSKFHKYAIIGDMKNYIIAAAIILLVTAIGGFLLLNKPQPANTPTTSKPEQIDQNTQSVQGYIGKKISGTTSPFLEFSQQDYDKAKAEG